MEHGSPRSGRPRSRIIQEVAMSPDLDYLVARFGAGAKAKLSNIAVTGEPEDHPRSPLEILVTALAEHCGFPGDAVVPVGETRIAELKTRPDYSIRLRPK